MEGLTPATDVLNRIENPLQGLPFPPLVLSRFRVWRSAAGEAWRGEASAEGHLVGGGGVVFTVYSIYVNNDIVFIFLIMSIIVVNFQK